MTCVWMDDGVRGQHTQQSGFRPDCSAHELATSRPSPPVTHHNANAPPGSDLDRAISTSGRPSTTGGSRSRTFFPAPDAPKAGAEDGDRRFRCCCCGCCWGRGSTCTHVRLWRKHLWGWSWAFPINERPAGRAAAASHTPRQSSIGPQHRSPTYRPHGTLQSHLHLDVLLG